MIRAFIVPDAIRSACNEVSVSIGIDPEGMLNTMCVPLVPVSGSDDAEATHWAACGKINEVAGDWLAENIPSFPGAMWWRWDDEGILVASYDSHNLGEMWGFQNCLEGSNLKRKSITL